MGQHLVAAGRAGRGHHDRARRLAHRLRRRWPRPRRRRRRSRRRWRGAPRGRRTPRAARPAVDRAGTSPTTTASTGTPPPAADRPRANVSVSRETSTAPPSASVSTSTRIIGPAPPASRRGRRRRGAASAPSPRICTSLGCGGGSEQPDPPGPGRLRGRRALLDLDLLGLHPAGDRRVARLDAALEHGDDRGQRHLVGLVAVGAVAAGDHRAVLDRRPGDAVDDRPAELVGQPDADLEVAGVGGVVAEQHQVVRRRASWSRTTRRSRARRRPGRSATASASTWVAAVQPRASAVRSCSTASASPSGQHGRRALGRRGDLHGQLDRALLVRADGEAGEAAVDGLPSSVSTTSPAESGDPLDADQHVGHRDPLVGRVEQRRSRRPSRR